MVINPSCSNVLAANSTYQLELIVADSIFDFGHAAKNRDAVGNLRVRQCFVHHADDGAVSCTFKRPYDLPSVTARSENHDFSHSIASVFIECTAAIVCESIPSMINIGLRLLLGSSIRNFHRQFLAGKASSPSQMCAASRLSNHPAREWPVVAGAAGLDNGKPPLGEFSLHLNLAAPLSFP